MIFLNGTGMFLFFTFRNYMEMQDNNNGSRKQPDTGEENTHGEETHVSPW